MSRKFPNRARRKWGRLIHNIASRRGRPGRGFWRRLNRSRRRRR